MTNEIVTTANTRHQHLICWKSAFAGLAVALLTFCTLTALTVALGGAGLSDGSSGTNAGIFTGVAFIVTCVLSTFAGAVYSVRAANHLQSTRPHAQSLLVASLILLFVLVQAASAVGSAGKAAGSALGATVLAAGTGVTAAGQNSTVQDIVEDNLGALNLKSSPETVFRGVTSRLVSGNAEGAKNYLAAQSGLTPEQADQKIAAAKVKVEEAAVRARETAATTMKATGWSLFATIVLSLLAAVLGGMIAHRKPNYVVGTSVNTKSTLVHG